VWKWLKSELQMQKKKLAEETKSGKLTPQEITSKRQAIERAKGSVSKMKTQIQSTEQYIK
jgi:hypothetical protein